MSLPHNQGHDAMIDTIEQFTTNWANDNILLTAAKPSTITPLKQEYRLRPSRLGGPGYITAYEYLLWLNSYRELDDGLSYYGRRQDIFTTGHEVEARLVNIMRQAGLVFETQVPVEFNLGGQSIQGTADMVLNDTVVDIKTASNSNFKRLLTGYGDITYRTQLALYAHGLQLDKVGLLIYNKDTSELAWRPIQLTNEVERVSDIITALTGVVDKPIKEAIEYINETFSITEPPDQMRQKIPTGKYLVPRELGFNHTIRDLLYETQVGSDGTRYVTYVYDHDELTERVTQLCSPCK